MTTKSRTDNYWEQRSIERQLLSEQKLSKYEKQIRSSYTKGMNAIETDLNLIMDNYQKYVNKRFGVQLSRTEASDFLNAVVDPSTMGQLRGRWKSRGVNIDEILAQTGNYSSRITNKQMYRQSVDLAMGEIASQEIEISKMAYTDIISDSYSRKIFDISKGTGLDLSMQSIDLNQIQNIMNMNWSGEHFSSRVWRNTSQVAKELKGLFTIDMLSNRPTAALINDLDNFTDYGRYASARLIRTESNAMRTETEAQVSMDLGLEKYRILATLDMKTSEVCQKMDLKVFLYKDLKIGETAPPFHPNCRTITQDQFDDVDYSKLERIARDPVTGETMYVPGDMTYEDWMNIKVERGKTEPNQVKPQTISQSELIEKSIDDLKTTNFVDIYGKENTDKFFKQFKTIEDPLVLDLYSKFATDLDFRVEIGSRNYFKPSSNTIHLSRDAFDGVTISDTVMIKPNMTAHHEIGHAIDKAGLKELTGEDKVVIGKDKVKGPSGKTFEFDKYGYNISQHPKYNLKEAIKNDLWTYVNGDLPTLESLGNKPRGREKSNEWYDKRLMIKNTSNANFEKIRKEMMNETDYSYRFAVSDVVESTGFVSYEKPFGAGHGKAYWKNPGNMEAEFFAQMFELKAADQRAAERFSNIFKESTKLWEQMVRDIMKAGRK